MNRPDYLLLFLLPLIASSCNHKNASPDASSISQLNLKRGTVISCGPPNAAFGQVEFNISCGAPAQKRFNLAIELLHSFEYDEAEKVFSKIIDETPNCPMAYWGIAMCNFHPLWNPPTEAELQKGRRALDIAHSIPSNSKRESGYIDALSLFYGDWKKKDHHARCVSFEKAMEQLSLTYQADKEAAVFYALSLDASALPTDKTYANQKKAAAILNTLYLQEPNHPGIIHYLIHTYDYPGGAILALPAARKYASVAPSSAHALHMPSHIFTRLGLWDDAIHSNLQSVEAAKCYAASADIPGHWDEELHGLDYLEYAYLQKGENKLAKDQVDYLQTMKSVYPVNFKVAYAFAAIPCRYVLENKQWKAAASLHAPAANIAWINFPWQESMIHFTRLLGDVHTGNKPGASAELEQLHKLRDTLLKQTDSYKAKEVAIQIKSGEAWIQFAFSDKQSAIQLMRLAADMEDSTEKHPVTPGEVLPARELLGDMLLAMQQDSAALEAYETVLKKDPNRFNSLVGAAASAEKCGKRQQALGYNRQLMNEADTTVAGRPEIAIARTYLKLHG